MAVLRIKKNPLVAGSGLKDRAGKSQISISTTGRLGATDSTTG